MSDQAPNTNQEQAIVLSDEQKLSILKKWQENPPPPISELTKLVFPELPEEMWDGRSKYSKVIKAFLTEKGFKSPPVVVSKGDVTLTTEQEEYIRNNCSTMKALEMARVLFNKANISPASKEVKSVISFLKTLPIDMSCEKPDELVGEEYKPPKKLDQVIYRINKYVKDARLDIKTLTPKQKKTCESLMIYLHNYRLKHQMDLYTDEKDKELFESAFVEYTWDKTDLSSEDCDQYIMLANEKVSASGIQKQIVLLQDEQERELSEKGKLSMPLVEMIKTTRDELNACTKRQLSLYAALTEQRSKRLSDQIKENASLLNIIQAWKIEESRQQMIKLAEEKKKKLGEEIDKLETLDEMKYRLLGLNKEEILNG